MAPARPLRGPGEPKQRVGHATPLGRWLFWWSWWWWWNILRKGCETIHKTGFFKAPKLTMQTKLWNIIWGLADVLKHLCGWKMVKNTTSVKRPTGLRPSWHGWLWLKPGGRQRSPHPGWQGMVREPDETLPEQESIWLYGYIMLYLKICNCSSCTPNRSGDKQCSWVWSLDPQKIMAGHHQAVVIQVCVRSDVRQLGRELWFQRQHCTWAMATRGSLTIYRYDIDIDIDIDI